MSNLRLRCLASLPVLLLLLAEVSRAEVQPSPLFSDHAVLQSGMSVPVWGTAAPGEKVTVTFLKQHRSAVAGSDGRWMVRLTKLKAGGPYDMTIAGSNTIQVHDVLVGEVWVGSGQSNMEFTVSVKAARFAGMQDEDKVIAAANYPQIRMFTVAETKSYTPLTVTKGKWVICSPETVGAFSAVGYLFAKDLQEALKVPVGIVTVAYGASVAEAWIPRDVVAADPLLKADLARFDAQEAFFKSHPGAAATDAPAGPLTINARAPRPGPLRDPAQDQHQPTVLFNGMVNGVIPYAIRGALWYQGESVVDGVAGVKRYGDTMDKLVTSWRSLWGEGDFPFFAVQLPALKNVSNNPAEREQQAKILDLPNTGLAVTIDIGDPNNVHPKNKAPLGERLTKIALAKVYGQKIEYSGPQYAGFQVTGDRVRVRFTHVDGGLVAQGGPPLQWFQVAGEDKVFHPAVAFIDGDTLVASSAEVPKPVALRYAWDNYPFGCNLFNKAGLPAAPFRTDDWDILTKISEEFTAK
jgi:sialate O-acetylesterase